MESSQQRAALDRPFTTKTDWVYEQLRARILSGEHKPDGRLRLTALAQEFQISEMPVREALRMLQRDGLVRMENHRGATVVNLSWERAAEIVSMRMHLELLATREATGRHTPQSLDEMKRLLDRMEQQGYVERLSAAKDRRLTLVRMTRAGEKMIASLIREAHAHEASVLEPIGAKRSKELKKVLRELIAQHRPALAASPAPARPTA